MQVSPDITPDGTGNDDSSFPAVSHHEEEAVNMNEVSVSSVRP